MVRLVVLVGLAAVGFGAGRWLGARPADVLPMGPPIPVIAAARVLEPKGDPCDQLALVEVLLARTRDEIEGVPRPFPYDPALQPAEFHRRLEAVRRACPEMVVDHVDCEEYPCFAWVRDACQETWLAMSIWPSSINGLTMEDGTRADWMTLSLASPDEGNAGAPPHGSDADVRLQTRTLRAREAIEATTGARPMTEVEIWSSNIESTERMLEKFDDNPEMRALLEKNLTEARAELERAQRAERGE